jgi:hypothetical protein
MAGTKPDGYEPALNRVYAMALHDGIHSYKVIKALVEHLTAEALALLDAPLQNELMLTQEHPLMGEGEDYTDLFTLGAQRSADLLLNHKESN